MIEVQNLSFSYGKRPILKDIYFQLHRGEVLGVLGVNGAGKSTLVTCLNGIRKPTTGEVYIDDAEILSMSRHDRAKRVAYVSQTGEVGHSTVFDTVLLGRKPHMKWMFSQEDLDLCELMIERVGLTELKLRMIDELSGGELQKVMLARALVQEPKLLLLDEPTSNLDPKNQHEMLDLVRGLAREHNFGVVMVLHDLNLAIRYCDRFLFLKDAGICAYGGPDTMNPHVIRKVYGISVLTDFIYGIPVIVPIPEGNGPPVNNRKDQRVEITDQQN
ncbi:MAG: ABC transporter ATP-binding protein [Tissierellia bacterium]|nr:ABC transporter ATP-binding protein [Tissierellia bacterium]